MSSQLSLSTSTPTCSCLAPVPSQPHVVPNPVVSSNCQCLHDASILSMGPDQPPNMVVSRFDSHFLGTCLNMLHCAEPLCVGTQCVCLQQYSARTMQAAHPVHLVPASVCAISQPIPRSVLVMYPKRFSCVVLHKSPSRNFHTVKLRWNNTCLSTCIFHHSILLGLCGGPTPEMLTGNKYA